MARTKLTLPDAFPFNTQIPVRITDINYGGHVGNDTVLSYLHEARMQYLSSFGYTELSLHGVGLIMSEVTIEFKAEIFYGDAITAHVAVADANRAGFQFYYKLVAVATDKIVALAKTGMVCFDYHNKKVVSIPEELRRVLNL